VSDLLLPGFGTPRRPERETTGTQVAETAARFGITLKPWQQYALDVAGEIDPATGFQAYDRVVISVGRRAGKTLAVWLKLMAMLEHSERGLGWFTRQSSKEAVLSFQSEFVPLLDRHDAPEDWRAYNANGSERVIHKPSGGAVRLFPPRATSLHGSSADAIVFDEAFAHDRELGNDLEIAAGPLLWTRPGGQIIITSAAGNLDSTWWNDWIAAGRESIAENRGKGTCHLEWTLEAFPDLDPADPATWTQVHPGQLRPEVYENEHARDSEMFLRTMLNVTDRKSSTISAIDQALWVRSGVPSADRVGAVTLGVDAAPMQSHASIVACYADGGVVEIVESREGVDWVLGRLLELHDRWDLYGVGVDPGAPIGMLTDAMHTEGLPVQEFTLRQTAAAAAQFSDAVKHATIRHVRDPLFDVAAVSARKRNVGDGAWAFSRLNSHGDVTPIVAASLARSCHPDVTGAGLVSIG